MTLPNPGPDYCSGGNGRAKDLARWVNEIDRIVTDVAVEVKIPAVDPDGIVRQVPAQARVVVSVPVIMHTRRDRRNREPDFLMRLRDLRGRFPDAKTCRCPKTPDAVFPRGVRLPAADAPSDRDGETHAWNGSREDS